MLRLLPSALVLALLLLSQVVHAQEEAAPPPAASVEASTDAQQPAPADGHAGTDPILTATLDELVATIQDPLARDRLIAQLQALIALRAEQAKPSDTESLLEQMSAFFGTVSAELSNTGVQLVDQIATIPDRLDSFWSRMQEPAERQVLLDDAMVLSGIGGVAIAVALGLWLAMRRVRQWLFRTKGRLPPLLLMLNGLAGFILQLLPLVLMMGATFAGLSLFQTTQSGAAILLAIVSAILVRRALAAALDLLFAPDAASRRLLPCDDDVAQRLTGSLDRLFGLGAYGFFTLEAVGAAGAEPALMEPLRSVYGLLLLASCVLLVLRYRKTQFKAPPESLVAAAVAVGTDTSAEAKSPRPHRAGTACSGPS